MISRSLGIVAALLSWVSVTAQNSTSIDISGVRIQNNLNQSRSSSPRTISPAYVYEYHITGMARGSGGLLGILYPTSVPLAQMLESLAPGSSALLNGFGVNPSGAHPVVLLNERIDGTSLLGAVTVTYGFNILIEANAVGNMSFSLTNVILQPSAVVGSILITSGTVQILRAPGVITGIVDLEDYAGEVSDPNVKFELRSPGSTTPVESFETTLYPGGRYILLTSHRGTYDVACKASHWLRRVAAEQSIADAGIVGLDFNQTNGDCDGDNEVTLVDYGLIAAAFGSTAGDSHWDIRADLDGDLEVTLFDLGILSAKFGMAGDD